MRVTAGYLPRGMEADVQWQTLTFESPQGVVEIEVPRVDAEASRELSGRLKKNAAYLKSLSVLQIVEILDQTINRLLESDNPHRQQMERFLPLITGYDAEMVRLGLTRYLRTFRKPHLLRFLEEDLGNSGLLDEFRPRVKGGFAKAYGPDLTVHVWAGNVPGIPLWSLVSALLVKSPSIGKVASAEPLFAGWFVQALAEVDAQFADCVAVVWWRGGAEEVERAVFAEADAVIGYGSNTSLAAVKSRVPVTTRFLAYGHKISFGMIGREALDSRKAWEIAHLAAYDIGRYDQQGCYSPHVFYVEQGGRVSPREFARMLAHELECLEHKFPRRPLTLAEAGQVAQWRQSAELQAMNGRGTEVLGEASSAWTVVCGPAGALEPSCLYRTIHVMEVDDLSQVPGWTADARDFLQTVGVATSPKRLWELAEALGRAGVTRVCAVGQMTSPEAGWHHDGRFNLLDLVRMIDLDQSAEDAAERYAPYYE